MKKLFRSQSDNKIAGVCGGLGEWMGIDSTIIRLLFIISAFFSFGAVVLIYFAAALFVPKSPCNDMTFTHFHY